MIIEAEIVVSPKLLNKWQPTPLKEENIKDGHSKLFHKSNVFDPTIVWMIEARLQSQNWFEHVVVNKTQIIQITITSLFTVIITRVSK